MAALVLLGSLGISPAIAGATTISTNASSSIFLGAGSLTDSAVVSGLVNPVAGASVIFSLYGPDDPTCSGPPAFTSSLVPYATDGSTVTSDAFVPAQAGQYRWIAAYTGDAAGNQPVAGVCNDPGESAFVFGPLGGTPTPDTPTPATPTPAPSVPAATCPDCGPPVNVVAPNIDGRAEPGQMLTCGSGLWTGAAPLTYTYTWLSSGSVVAMGPAYRVRATDVTRRVRCSVRGLNTIGVAYASSPSMIASRRRVLIRTAGGIKPPGGVATRVACRGTISLKLLKGSRELGRHTARLTRTCRWSWTFSVPGGELGSARTLKLRIRFNGSRYIAPGVQLRELTVPTQ